MTTLKSYLEMTGKTVESLAKDIGIAPSTLYRNMAGETELKMSTLRRIHEISGIKTEILVTEFSEAIEEYLRTRKAS